MPGSVQSLELLFYKGKLPKQVIPSQQVLSSTDPCQTNQKCRFWLGHLLSRHQSTLF